jgi:hypothetical protein
MVDMVEGEIMGRLMGFERKNYRCRERWKETGSWTSNLMGLKSQVLCS